MFTIIIAIIVLVLFKFLFDTFRQSERIASEGGVRTKYAVLIDNLLAADPRNKVFQETNTFISVGISGTAGSQVFYITPAYGHVSIVMEVKNNPLFGNQKMEWKFPEDMNQEHMLMKMNNDIEEKFKTLIERYK